MSAGTASLRSCVLAGGLLGGTGVALGAFGAHALRGKYAADLLEHWDTAVRYQLWHALAVLLVAVLAPHLRWPRAAAACFVGGTGVFSGSLYVLVLSGQKWLGAVTPVGGLLLIAGWVVVAAGVRGETGRGEAV